MVDYTSDFMKSEEHEHRGTEEVVMAIKQSFARWGVPVIVHSDNGPQFMSHLVSKFFQSSAFEYTSSTPESNGKVKAATKMIKRLLFPQKVENSTTEESRSHAEKQHKRLREQEQYNKGAKNLKQLQREPVFVKDYRQHRREWMKARVLKQPRGRTYSVQVDEDLVQRNRRDLGQ
ncbi:uncharacterized protein [Watersipora subatra]|uniref:uncharacterized protein n=1 Tax=Watersipora subatra TaxID=2589382 RepID=UPI00355B65DA